jgi:hypothetical protein
MAAVPVPAHATVSSIFLPAHAIISSWFSLPAGFPLMFLA